MFTRNHFVWKEPWFFSIRVRHWQAWLGLFVLLFLVAGAVAALMHFFGPNPDWTQIAWVSVGVVAVLWAIIDGPMIRRVATLDAKNLYVDGEFGQFSRQDKYPLEAIKLAVIRDKDEINWPCSTLFLASGQEMDAIGIGESISLNRLASALHDLGIPVQLKGWDPDAENEFEKVFAVDASDVQAVKPIASMEVIAPEPNKLFTPVGMMIAIFKQCWAGAIAMAVIGYSVYLNVSNFGNMGLVNTVLSIFIPIAVMYVAGVYTSRFATASTSKTLTDGAKSQLKGRPGVSLNLESPGLHPVEIFEGDQFGNSIQKIYEMGFVEVDLSQNRLLFEGKKERWEIPANSLRRMAIQEVQIGADGDTGAGTKNYYVVTDFDTPVGSQKFGFRCSIRDYGVFNDIKRAQQAMDLFEKMSVLVI